MVLIEVLCVTQLSVRNDVNSSKSGIFKVNRYRSFAYKNGITPTLMKGISLVNLFLLWKYDSTCEKDKMLRQLLHYNSDDGTYLQQGHSTSKQQEKQENSKKIGNVGSKLSSSRLPAIPLLKQNKSMQFLICNKGWLDIYITAIQMASVFSVYVYCCWISLKQLNSYSYIDS